MEIQVAVILWVFIVNCSIVVGEYMFFMIIEISDWKGKVTDLFAVASLT